MDKRSFFSSPGRSVAQLPVIGLLLAAAVILGGCGGESTPVAAAAPASTTAPAATAVTTQAAASVTPTQAGDAAGTPAAAQPQSPLATGAAPGLPAVHATTLAAPKLYTYRVLNVRPHDATAFTQGLQLVDGVFYEGTGLEGQSSLRRVDPKSGTVLQQDKLDPQFFGEGVTVLGDKIYQLTWKNNTGIVYDKNTLKELRRFSYATEGWGLTNDGQRLILSDGTPQITFYDPNTLQPTGAIMVSLFGLPISQINELEYIDGRIYANLWQTNLIVRINPASGQIDGVVDLSGLLSYAPPSTSQTDVLNGIAYDPKTGHLLVTGKLWPALFEIELVEVS